jgi:hypothetical protein
MQWIPTQWRSSTAVWSAAVSSAAVSSAAVSVSGSLLVEFDFATHGLGGALVHGPTGNSQVPCRGGIESRFYGTDGEFETSTP